ncbi:hypothetical protein Hanom_Chr17g01526431 [Helianthus anomalus]
MRLNNDFFFYIRVKCHLHVVCQLLAIQTKIQKCTIFLLDAFKTCHFSPKT